MIVPFRHDMMHERNIAVCINAVGVDKFGNKLMQNVPKPKKVF